MSTDSFFFLSPFKVSFRVCFSLLTASPCSNSFLQAKKWTIGEVHNSIVLLCVAGNNLYSLVNASTILYLSLAQYCFFTYLALVPWYQKAQ